MQITKLAQEKEPLCSYTKTFTAEELEREFDYYAAQKLLEKMLDLKLITDHEFNKITEKNRQIFSPYLSEIMPKMT